MITSVYALHVALSPYVHDRCKHSAYNKEEGVWLLPRTARLACRFVQQLHGRTVAALQEAAGVKEAQWFLREEWLDIGVCRTVVSNMLLPFVKHPGKGSSPKGAWGWEDMFLHEWETTTIVTATVKGFLSAHPDEILRAADRNQLVE